VSDVQAPVLTDGSSPEAPRSPAPWYRRRAFLVGASVAVVVAITVITDLPVQTSRASDIAAERSVMKEVNGDIAPCALGAHEAFAIYGQAQQGTLSASDRAAVPGLLRDDQSACSFTNNSIYDLSNIEVPGSPAGKHLGNLVGAATLWVTSDALGAIEDIQTLVDQPTDNKALTDLGTRERQLAVDRRGADDELRAANRVLGARLPLPDLPALPIPTR